MENINQIETEEETYQEPQVVNRSIAIFHPNEEFYSWYSLHTKEEDRLSVEEVTDKPLSFLIPPVSNEEEAEDFIYENSLSLLETVLEEFIDDETLIETALTEDNFDSWLDYNYSPFVLDLATDFELEHEDEDDEEAEVEESQNFTVPVM